MEVKFEFSVCLRPKCKLSSILLAVNVEVLTTVRLARYYNEKGGASKLWANFNQTT